MSDARACFNCGESGHMSRECPKPRQGGDRGFGGGRGGDRGGRGGGFRGGAGRGGSRY